MGQIDDAIAAINADDGLTPGQKRRARGQVKSQALIDFVQVHLPYTLPLSGNRSVEFLTANVAQTPEGSCVWTATGVFRRNGVIQPFSWPWVVVNPPMLVEVGSPGQADTTRIIDGETRYFKEDPWQVLQLLADRTFV